MFPHKRTPQLTEGIDLIGAAISCGGLKRGPEKGPAALMSSNSQWLEKLRSCGIHIRWNALIEADEQSFWNHCSPILPKKTIPIVADFAKNLSRRVEETCRLSRLPAVIGGDHSVAIGTWSGIANTLNEGEKMGLIWLDAHLDSHTPETSDTQAIHGMPLAVLLGHGDVRLTKIAKGKTKLSPENVTLIGVRSYEPGEMDFLNRLGIRICLMGEVKMRGFGVVFNEAVKRATDQTAGFGISIDLDAFDPTEAAGVTTPVSQGLNSHEVLSILKEIGDHPSLLGLEIAEFSPKHDPSQFETLHLIQDILMSLIGSRRSMAHAS